MTVLDSRVNYGEFLFFRKGVGVTYCNCHLSRILGYLFGVG